MSDKVIEIPTDPSQPWQPWHTPRDHEDLFEENGVADHLQLSALWMEHTRNDYITLTKRSPFLAECAFLNHWNSELLDGPNQEGIQLDIYINPDGGNGDDILIHPDSEVVIEIGFHDPNAASGEDDFEHILMIYTPDPAHPGRHALQIIHNDNVVYQRTAEMDPATEWEINEMAGDPEVTDGDGNLLFDGDPVNI